MPQVLDGEWYHIFVFFRGLFFTANINKNSDL
jgi:hypothetical protein